jgi:hypothetical protein
MPDDPHQGTWQFMAAELILTPHIAHTFMHDLESVIWVLMWITLKYTVTNWSVGVRSSFVSDTMSPRVFMNSGGQNKLFFMQSPISLKGFTVDQNPQLTSLLFGLKEILHRHHVGKPLDQRDDDSSAHRTPVEDISEDVFLKAHALVIDTFNKYLDSPNWPNNDEAQLQPIVLSNDVQISMHSSSKRSREVAEGSGVYSWLPPAKRSGSA